MGHAVDNPSPPNDNAPPQGGDVNQYGVRYQGFAKGAARFTRGEEIWYGNGEFYFTCTDGGSAKAGQLYQFARNALNSSEFAGACFSLKPALALLETVEH